MNMDGYVSGKHYTEYVVNVKEFKKKAKSKKLNYYYSN